MAESPHGVAEVLALFAEVDLLASWNPLVRSAELLELKTGVPELSLEAIVRLQLPPLPSLLLHYIINLEDRIASEGCIVASARSGHGEHRELPVWASRLRKLPFSGAECRLTPLPPGSGQVARERSFWADANGEGAPSSMSAEPPLDGVRSRLDVRFTIDLSNFRAVRMSPKWVLDMAVYCATPWGWAAARYVLSKQLAAESGIGQRLRHDAFGVYGLVRKATGQPQPPWLDRWESASFASFAGRDEPTGSDHGRVNCGSTPQGHMLHHWPVGLTAPPRCTRLPRGPLR